MKKFLSFSFIFTFLVTGLFAGETMHTKGDATKSSSHEEMMSKKDWSKDPQKATSDKKAKSGKKTMSKKTK